MPYKEKNAQKNRNRNYYLQNRERILEKQKEYYKKNKQKIKKYMKQWRNENKDKIQNYSKKIKLQAMQIVSKRKIPKCVSCGCKDIRILQINHKNLDGRKDRVFQGNKFYKAILKGKRKPNGELEILCRVCNAKHYVEKKFGIKFKIELIENGAT